MLALGLAGLVAAAACASRYPAAEASSDGIGNRAFWRMFAEFSEPPGSFPSDNLISNEIDFQSVVPALTHKVAPGGAYLGVGPDQNFTYIVALRPSIAFIVDIRRENAMVHLFHKALLEMSADRAEYLSRLFGRPRPPSLGPNPSPQALLDAFTAATPDTGLRDRTRRAVVARLTQDHGFPLGKDDLQAIDYVHQAFVEAGPDLRYSFPRSFGGNRFPSYRELMLATDQAGVNHAYLATEESFHLLRDMEARNLIIPVVGDFAGPRALRAVARYLADAGLTVGAFYTSNVEYYLFQQDRWRAFYANVAALPLDDRSTFIRSASRRFLSTGARGVNRTLLDRMADLITAFNDDQLQTYADLMQRSK